MVPLVDGNACNFYNVATTITSRLHLARLSFTGARARARVSAFQPRSHAGSDRARSNPLRKVPAANPAGRDCIHYLAIINFWFAQLWPRRRARSKTLFARARSTSRTSPPLASISEITLFLGFPPSHEISLMIAACHGSSLNN